MSKPGGWVVLLVVHYETLRGHVVTKRDMGFRTRLNGSGGPCPPRSLDCCLHRAAAPLFIIIAGRAWMELGLRRDRVIDSISTWIAFSGLACVPCSEAG